MVRHSGGPRQMRRHITPTPRSIVGILLFVLLAVLIATYGFWDTLSALLGAAGMVVLVVLLAGAALGIGGYTMYKRRGE